MQDELSQIKPAVTGNTVLVRGRKIDIPKAPNRERGKTFFQRRPFLVVCHLQYLWRWNHSWLRADWSRLRRCGNSCSLLFKVSHFSRTSILCTRVFINSD